MKFLVYGNSPRTPTGYGVQIRHLVSRLKRDGHDVAVACTYGHQVGVAQYPTEYGPVTLYPSGRLENSLDVLEAHALHFFGGDPKAGWIIPVTDVWVLNVSRALLDLTKFQVLAWTPVDHWPAPPGVVQFFQQSGARPLAMSQFGQRQLIESGDDPLYAPLAVETSVYRPTFGIHIGPNDVVDARTYFDIPQGAFVALMVAMNKDPADRKGFNEAFRAFGAFWKQHQNAVLVVHTNARGSDGSGINLHDLAKHAAIPPHALIFTDQYAQLLGFSDEMMAGLYTAADVLLCPSRGEGFGVPMIEAQACGTPVIASDFTAQTELVGAGWMVTGQLQYDPSQGASYLCPSVQQIHDRLCDAYGADMQALSKDAIAFASDYDVERVWDEFWRPVLRSLEPWTPEADKPPMERVDIIVPLMRDANRARFESSLRAAMPDVPPLVLVGQEGRTYAENVNECLKRSTADWVLIVGDDVEFTPGWFEAARELSDRYDVIGTNDSERGRMRNPDVAAGRHADHFFVRRTYIDLDGACLDGPGVLMPEAYNHWYTDKELVELAKARGVYGHAHDCRIIHHHPGYDGDEAAREADPLYMRAVESSEQDRRTFMQRLPIIQAMRGQR